jgi:hypothetical protein
MTSKYGNQLYGDDLYSASGIDLEGVPLSFSLAPFGQITTLSTFQGTLPIVTTFDGGLTKSYLLTGTFSISTPLSGALFTGAALQGQVSIAPVLSGTTIDISTNPNLGGTIFISLDLLGRLETQMDLIATPLSFEVSLSDEGLFIGGFWVPGVPINEFWVPDVPVSNFWVPDVPVNWNG